MTAKIVRLEEILTSKADKTNKDSSDNNSKRKAAKRVLEGPPRGKPKSGRIWKNTKTKFSSIIKSKGIKNSFEKKKALQEELKRVKEASKAVIAEKNEEKELKKQRRRENLRRKEENSKKSEVVQVIKNSSKIKRMKRKQLRHIEKRDTN